METIHPWRAVLAVALAAALSAGGLAVAPLSAAADDADLLVRYDFSAATATSVPDASGNGRDATILGAGARVVGAALELPGGANASGAAYVQLPTGLIDGRDTLTIQTWLRNDTGAGNYAAAFFGTTESLPAQYWLLNPRNPQGRFKSVITTSRNTNAPWSTEAGISGPSAGSIAGPQTNAEWGLYTTVLEPGRLTGYYNGRSIGTVETNRSLRDLGTGLVGYIGRSSYGDPFYRGGVRDFEIHTTALSAQQVQDAYWTGVDPDVRDAALAADADALELGGPRVATDLVLPSSGAQGSRITWTSSDPDRLGADGRVARPTDGEDAVVTLTATLALGGVETTRPFRLIVAAVSAQGDVEQLAESLVVRPVLASGERLPAAPQDATVGYGTTSAGLTIVDGVVTATGEVAVDGEITATLTSAGASTEKTFDVTVLPAAVARSLLAYERTPLAVPVYGPKVAYSMHLGLGTTPAGLAPLNENSGVLFAEAQPTAELDIVETRTLRDPYVFPLADGGWGVLATRALGDGSPDPAHRGQALLFTTDDLVAYDEVGFVALGGEAVVDPRAVWDSAAETYRVTWKDASGAEFTRAFTDLADPATRGPLLRGGLTLPEPTVTTSIQGAVPTSLLVIPAAAAETLEHRLGRIRSTAVDVVDTTIAQGDAVPQLGAATLDYSDGSTRELPVDWSAADLAAVDTSTPGAYEVRGTVRQRAYAAPFIRDEADPDILRWRDRYLFISTDDRAVVGAQPGMFLRSAATIDGLRTAPDHIVVTRGTSRIAGCYWAPELHELAGDLYIYYAPCIDQVSWTRVVAHVQKLRPGGDPTVLADWEAPRPVLQQDGSPLQRSADRPGISLDMTVFEDAGRTYVTWSQRYIGARNGDAEMWIATIDPTNPWRLTSEPKKLASASYGWETNTSNVAEGAAVLHRDGKLYLTYSASNIDRTYAVGLLVAESGADLLDADAWTKSNAPLLKSDASANLWGPGHNNFTVDEDGQTLLVFHARSDGNPNRDTYLRRVHWAADGTPILDMTPEEEVAPQLRTVTATITVEAPATRIEAVASTRCVAGTAVVILRTANPNDSTATVAATSDWGVRSQTIGAGRSASIATNTRAAAIEAGSIAVQATIGGASATVEAGYPATRCG